MRINTRLIRANVSWWFHDIESDDGVHVHHMVIGVVLMVVAGLLLIALLPTGLWLQLIAMLFGAGVALTLDEFALILRLQDVYWRKEGRLSVDAVVVVLCVAFLFLLGFRPLVGDISSDDETDAAAYAVLATGIVVNFAFAVLCFLKGKMWTGLFGLFIPFVALVGSIRLARPGSPWARWRYTKRPKKLARAQRREERAAASWRAWKTALLDAVAGKPHLPSILPPVAEETPVPERAPLPGEETPAPDRAAAPAAEEAPVPGQTAADNEMPQSRPETVSAAPDQAAGAPSTVDGPQDAPPPGAASTVAASRRDDMAQGGPGAR